MALKKLIALIIPVVAVVALYYVFYSYPLPQSYSTVDDSQPDTLLSMMNVQAEEPKEPTLMFGIEVDSLEVVEAKIQPNQFLSQILTQYNISLGMIDQLAKKSREIFDVRKIRSNKKYTLLCSADSSLTAKYFIYEPNQIDYVVYDLQDSISIYTGQHPVDTLVKTFAGIIDYSIYQTLEDNNAPTDLVYKLSDIYAWQIDLFKIQKGDRFKVIYEEVQIRGERVGLGKVLAAHFERSNGNYFAFYFDQGGQNNYFDEEGNSLRKAFLKAPLKYSRISSRFSNDRFHPVLKVHRPHYGIDYAAPKGTPVRAVGDGTITKANYSGGAGNYVKIKHNSVYTTGYMHLSKYGPDIHVGKKVKQGDIIGYVGNTGISTGPHLCFRTWKNGKPVDALSIEMPPSEPIKDEFREGYNEVMERMTDELNKLAYPKSQFILADAKTSLKIVSIN